MTPIEIMARAIHGAVEPWAAFEVDQAEWIKAATAALQAIRDAGYVIVPREPTKEMLWAGDQSIDTCTKVDPCDKAAKHCYGDMLQAYEGGE